MNLPNKLTITRIILAIIIIIFLLLPFDKIGINLPDMTVGGFVRLNVKYIICAVLFVIAAFTDLLDGYIARSNNMVSDYGKVMDAIADKLLVNGVLIVLSCYGFVNVIIPLVIVCRDIFVDSFKMLAGKYEGAVAASKLGKVKTVLLLSGITLMLIYNLPFELWGFRFADLLLIIGTILSVVSGIEYYLKLRKYLTK